MFEKDYKNLYYYQVLLDDNKYYRSICEIYVRDKNSNVCVCIRM